ncbi:hypothetical protein QQP08_019690, partial [Theobroma cacao]
MATKVYIVTGSMRANIENKSPKLYSLVDRSCKTVALLGYIPTKITLKNYLSDCCSYYSMYGHVEKLAQEIKKGAASVEGVEVKLWQNSLRFKARINDFTLADCKVIQKTFKRQELIGVP